jgi:hypothetical protein
MPARVASVRAFTRIRVAGTTKTRRDVRFGVRPTGPAWQNAMTTAAAGSRPGGGITGWHDSPALTSYPGSSGKQRPCRLNRRRHWRLMSHR